ncbi:MAG: primosomal protein N' [Nitrospira sp.]
MLPPSSHLGGDELPHLYAEVIVPRHLAKTFTYLVPPMFHGRVVVGSRVTVPFGYATLEGAVIALTDRLSPGVLPSRVKAIADLPEGTAESGFPPGLFELSKRVADEYLAPWGQCLRLITAPVQTAAQSSWRLVATEEGRSALTQGRCPDRHRPVLERIARRQQGLSSTTLRDAPGTSLTFLESQQWILRSNRPQPTRPARAARLAPSNQNHCQRVLDHEALPPLDPAARDRITALTGLSHASRLLVEGRLDYRLSLLVHVIRQARVRGKSVLVLVGEAARAEWIRQTLESTMHVPVHSSQPVGEGIGEAAGHRDLPQIVVGTRSAVFHPLTNIGAIWIDGEEDVAFKEPQEPRYHARDVAWWRAQQERALLVYGSAHPSLEVRAVVDIESCVEPVPSADLPTVELIDLSREAMDSSLSAPLVAALHNALAGQDRAVLFLNRRGYAGALVCRDCGWVPRCVSCGIAVAYSRDHARLVCRYCGTVVSLPETCGNCGASRLSPVGEGTERVEQDVRQWCPAARIIRIDGDTTRSVKDARRLWGEILSSSWDILIGTQALFQRGPIPSAAVVGVVQADTGLHVSDFRAAERTYQLLVDAAQVAKSASAGGRVLLQTRLPKHHAIQALVTHDPARFYSEELLARRVLGFPPIHHLIYTTVSGKDRVMAEQAATQWTRLLREQFATESRTVARGGQLGLAATQTTVVLGPVPTPGVRRPGATAWRIMVKGPDRVRLREGVRLSLDRIERAYPRRSLRFSVDVDPVEMV